MSLSCQTCGGLMRREPAVISCTNCGRFGVVTDAQDEDWRRQMHVDWLMRPRSAECLPDYNIPAPVPHQPGRGWVSLPDPSRPKKKRRASRAKAVKIAEGNGHMPPDYDDAEEVMMTTDFDESVTPTPEPQEEPEPESPRINPLINELRALRGQTPPELREKAVELVEAIWLSRKYDNARKQTVSYAIARLIAK